MPVSKVRGKDFEGELAESMRAAGVLTHRIRDGYTIVGGHKVSQKNPCDFYAWKPTPRGVVCLAVEAKATSEASLPFDNVQPHQVESLLEFECAHPDMHGFLAVNFYSSDGLRDGNRMFFVPIITYASYVSSSGRKSLPKGFLEEDPTCVECMRVEGMRWDVGRWADTLEVSGGCS